MIYNPQLSLTEIIIFSVWITFTSLLFTLYIYDLMNGKRPQGFKNNFAPFAIMSLSMYWLMACFGIIRF